MRTELPKKWCVRINTILDYPDYALLRKINLEGGWVKKTKGPYYLYSDNKTGFCSPGELSLAEHPDYKLIYTEEFKVLVLGEKPSEPNYEIY